MKIVSLLLIGLMLLLVQACRPQTVASSELPAAATPVRQNQVDPAREPGNDLDIATPEPAVPTATFVKVESTAAFTPAATATMEVESSPAVPLPGVDLPILPPFQEANANGIGDPLSGDEQDPFANATFVLATELPDGPETAVIQEHSFSLVDEASARDVADQLGFSGPLYVQRIAPEFAPAEGEDHFTMFTAFDGSRILNISDNGVTLEDRGVVMDYDNRPSFAAAVQRVEAQLEEWGLLDFPYEIRDLDGSVMTVYRLINGIPNNQNEFNMFFNQKGELYYFDYHPLRVVKELGNYPLQSAEMAWRQIQQPAEREEIRYEIWPPQPYLSPVEGFVNPRSWVPLSDPGHELHLYMTPAVYEATDGSGLRLMYGDFTLSGDEEQLAEMATHLVDVLHVWGTTGLEDGTKTLDVQGWEPVNMVSYETIEGKVETQEDGQRVLLSITGETFILPAVPDDVENGVEVYASALARRDFGANHPMLDWNSLTEKIEWPEVHVATPEPEPKPIAEIIVDDAALTYFTIYQSAGVPGQGMTLLLLLVWRFGGESEQGHPVTFWVPAVMPEYLK